MKIFPLFWFDERITNTNNRLNVLNLCKYKVIGLSEQKSHEFVCTKNEIQKLNVNKRQDVYMTKFEYMKIFTTEQICILTHVYIWTICKYALGGTKSKLNSEYVNM